MNAAAVRPSEAARRHAGHVELVAPWYAPTGGCALHRYLDDEFVARFLGELEAGGPGDHAWPDADRFGGSALPVLRLPVHRAFYVVAAELHCVQPGHPALDPRHIVDAGCVVRRHDPRGGLAAWMLAGGRPLGWRMLATADALREPHAQRRLVAARLLGPAALNAPYDGEDTHPLHARLVRDAQGRAHCVLWGYLPLGGSAPASPGPLPAADPATQALADEIPWPLGGAERGWQAGDGALLVNGTAHPALTGLLRVLLLRYRLGADGAAAQPRLAELAAALPLKTASGADFQRNGRPVRLADWLRDDGEALADWLNTCTPSSSPPALSGGGGGLVLGIDADTARAWRLALAAARDGLLADLRDALPLPRYAQGANDVYRVHPFVRTLDACGCERITFGTPGFAFRVAAPWEPEAARPVAIPVPGLADLRRGLARGVGFRMPADTGSLIAGLRGQDRAQDALSGQATAGPGFGFGMLCSFSLPILTLCALIMLTIMISLLNLVFRWLPFVQICIPWPKREDES